MGRPIHRFRRLTLTRLEDRLAPVSNVLANVPEANQANLTSRYTQSTTAAVAFGNTIIVAYVDSGSFVTEATRHIIGYSRSTDGGATFTDLGALTSFINDIGSPLLARDEQSGRIYLKTGSTNPSIGETVRVYRSDDGGLTFPSSVSAFPDSVVPDYRRGWLAVDNFAGTGRGNVYAVANFDFASIVLSRSTNGGESFSAPVTVTTGNYSGLRVVVNADHSVSVFWHQAGTPQSIRTRRSTDFGATFGPESTVAELVTTGTDGNLGLTRTATGGGSFQSNAFPQVVASPVTPGVLYATYADKGVGTDKADIKFTQSNDFGATWSAPITVNTDGTTRDQWQPSLRITPDGRQLSIGWYDRRFDDNNALIDYFARTATLSGTSVVFGTDFRVSDVSFAPVFGRDSITNITYMGDQDVGAATNSRFYYAWGDNRLGGADVRVSAVSITGPAPSVFTASPITVGTAPAPIDVTFDQPMDPASFALADDVLVFTRNGIDIRGSLTGFTWLNGNTTLRLTGTASGPGAYALRLGSQIRSATGQLLDNDFDGTPGESPDDEYALNFIVAGPRVASSTPAGTATAPVASATFDFSEPMDTASFSVAEDVFSFTSPAGNLVQFITGFSWVTDRQLRIDFTAKTLPGSYSLVLNPTVVSSEGVALDTDRDGLPGETPADRYTVAFTIGPSGPQPGNAFGYRFAPTAYNPALDLSPSDIDVTTMFPLGFLGAVQRVDLGPHTFTFFGETLQFLDVDPYGKININRLLASFTNSDLSFFPSCPTIAVLWDDLDFFHNTPGSDDVILRAFRDATGDGQPDLIVNWRNVHYASAPNTNADGITFQVVLELNTGSRPGAIIFNYKDLDEINSGAQNMAASATAGIKNFGNQTTSDALLVAYDGSNPTLVGNQRAVRIVVNDPPRAVANGPYGVPPGGGAILSGAGSADPNGDPLTYLWDLDGDGTFGETGAGALRGDENGPAPVFNAAGLPAGTYPVALRVLDPRGTFDTASMTVTVGGAAPRVASALVNGSAAVQRSSVRSLVVTFDATVTLPANVADAFRLEKLGAGGGDVTLAGSAQVVGGVTVVTLTFAGAFTEGGGALFPDPSLVDGNYRLTVRADRVIAGGVQLDGNGDGTVGDDYVLGNAPADALYRLYGDANGDRTVNAADFAPFRGAFGTSTGQAAYLDFLDFNGDGVINAFDFAQFRTRFGMSLP